MGNTSSSQSISSSTSSPLSSTSSKSSKHHFNFPSHPFSRSRLHKSSSMQSSSSDKQGALLGGDQNDKLLEDNDGTYLLRRGSSETRGEWLARKQIIATRIQGDRKNHAGVAMWNNYSIEGGRGQI